MKKIMIFVYSFISFLCLSTITNVFALDNFQDFELKQNVEPNKEWTIKFNELINDDSVRHDSIYIEDDAGKKVKCTLKVLNNSVIVKPCTDYEKGKTYCLFVNKKIKSRNKKIIKKPVKMFFKIKEAKKNNIVIKNNEIYIKSKNEINDVIYYFVQNNLNSVRLNFKNCNDELIECQDAMFETISQIRGCVVEQQIIEFYDSGDIINLSLRYPYYKNNIYQTLFKMADKVCEATLNKHTLKIGELGKISFKVPPKSKIKFSVEDPKILKVDANGNVIPLSDGETNVLIDIKDSSLDFDEGFQAGSLYIPVSVVSKSANNINKLDDIWEVIHSNLGQEEIPIYITNKNLSQLAIQKEIEKLNDKIKSTIGGNYGISCSLDDSMTHIRVHNFYKQIKNEEIKNVYDAVENKATKILDSIIKPGMTEFEKEKAIHDYVVLNTAYDDENYLKNTIPFESYTPYGVIVKGIGVCQGYAESVNYLLNRAGIESCVVYGTARNSETEGGHAWNIVKIDGKYYQLDVTWDDPVPDKKGRVEYDYFNLTDDEIGKNHTWDRKRYTKKCTSKRFMKIFRRKY